MKKIVVFIAAALLCFIVAACSKSGTKPFSELKAEDISSVSVNCMPPDKTVQTEDKEKIESLVKALNKVVIYEEDEKEYAGQSVTFTINKTDGSQIKINAYNPQIIIDGVKYVAKHDPCEELSSIGNEWITEMPSTYKSFEEIKELLAAYPSDYESVLQSGCYVISGDEAVSGQDLYDQFAKNTDNGISDDITIVNFTAEGDPIYGYLYYDGDKFTYTMDISRDKYKGEYEDYMQFEYDYLFNSSEDGVSYTYLSNNPDMTKYSGAKDLYENGNIEDFLLLFSVNEQTLSPEN